MLLIVKRAILWPDTHIGIDESHDHRAVELALWICRELQPEYIYFLGDLADFYSVMSHTKDPNYRSILKDELYLVNKFLDRVRDENKNCELHFIEGNHEYRAARYLAEKAPDLIGIYTVNDLLMLESRNIYYHAYGPSQLVQVMDTNLYARHEPYGRSPEASARKAMCSLINGHDHRIAQIKISSAHGNVCHGISCGWLGNANHKIFSYVKTRAQWQLGFGIVTDIDGIWFYQQVYIQDYKCIVDGVLYAL
jgi:UDP-2,3-diacylglucosamine pyrophosphatase LpxH